MTAGGRAEAGTLAQHADAAERAVRTLTRHTRPGVGQPTEPTEAAQVIAALAVMAGLLPQLLDQLASGLLDQHQHRRLRVDSLTPAADAGQAVHAIVAALAHAGECARRASHHLDAAHQHAAHLMFVAADDSAGGRR